MNYTSVGWFNFLCRFPFGEFQMKIGPKFDVWSMCKEERAVTIGMEVDTVWIYECAREDPECTGRARGIRDTSQAGGSTHHGALCREWSKPELGDAGGPKGGSGQCCGLTSPLSPDLHPHPKEEDVVDEDFEGRLEAEGSGGGDDIRELLAKKLALARKIAWSSSAPGEDPGGARQARGSGVGGGLPSPGRWGWGEQDTRWDPTGSTTRVLPLLLNSGPAPAVPSSWGSKAGSGSSPRIC